MESGESASRQVYTLRNGNAVGDPSKSPRCGAKTRSGAPCRAPAMWSKKAGKYTRCRMHGGASTGPRTPEGIERCRKAAWKHGRRSAQEIAERRAFRRELQWMRWETDQLARDIRAYLKEKKRLQKLAQSEPAVLIVSYETYSGINQMLTREGADLPVR